MRFCLLTLSCLCCDRSPLGALIDPIFYCDVSPHFHVYCPFLILPLVLSSFINTSYLQGVEFSRWKKEWYLTCIHTQAQGSPVTGDGRYVFLPRYPPLLVCVRISSDQCSTYDQDNTQLTILMYILQSRRHKRWHSHKTKETKFHM